MAEESQITIQTTYREEDSSLNNQEQKWQEFPTTSNGNKGDKYFMDEKLIPQNQIIRRESVGNPSQEPSNNLVSYLKGIQLSPNGNKEQQNVSINGIQAFNVVENSEFDSDFKKVKRYKLSYDMEKQKVLKGFIIFLAISILCIWVYINYFFMDNEDWEQYLGRIDWSYLNVGVKKQACDDSYANAAIMLTEQYFSSEPLSIQQLLDCDTYNKGCQKGAPIYSLRYILQNKIALESTYPYQNEQSEQNRKCSFDDIYMQKSQVLIDSVYDSLNNKDLLNYQSINATPNLIPSESTKSDENEKKNQEEQDQTKGLPFFKVPFDTTLEYTFQKNDCKQIRFLLTNGPVLVQINKEAIDLYNPKKKDIILQHQEYDEKYLNKSPDYSVVIVGFTKEYWLVQTSMGKDFGDNGIIKIKMGNYFNICNRGVQYSSEFTKIKNEKTNYVYSGSN